MTTKEGFAPDFGLFWSKAMPNAGAFTFMEMEINALYWIGEGLYSVNERTGYNGEEYHVTIDIPRAQFEELLASHQPGMATQIRRYFAGDFTRPHELRFPHPTSATIEARLGELQRNTNEEYIPFVATRVV